MVCMVSSNTTLYASCATPGPACQTARDQHFWWMVIYNILVCCRLNVRVQIRKSYIHGFKPVKSQKTLIIIWFAVSSQAMLSRPSFWSNKPPLQPWMCSSRTAQKWRLCNSNPSNLKAPSMMATLIPQASNTIGEHMGTKVPSLRVPRRSAYSNPCITYTNAYT